MTPGGNNFNDFHENPLTKFACSLNSRPIKAKWFTGVCGAVFKKPLATGLFVLLAYTTFVQLQSLVVISTHADRQSVAMTITVCLFVNWSLCTVTDFSAGDKASGVKFCTMFHGRPGHGISHFGELCSSRSPKSDESAPVLKICCFQKRAPYQRGGCPDTLDLPL